SVDVEDVALGEVGIRLVGVGERLRRLAGVEHGDAARDATEGLGHLGGEARRDRGVVSAGGAPAEKALAFRAQGGGPARGPRAGILGFLMQGSNTLRAGIRR